MNGLGFLDRVAPWEIGIHVLSLKLTFELENAGRVSLGTN